MTDPGGRRPALFLVAEEVRSPADEGYDRAAQELVDALRRRVPVRVHFTRPAARRRMASARLGPRLRRTVALLDPRLHGRLVFPRPDAVLYLSRSSASGPAFLRCGLLKLSARRPVVMLALQEWGAGWRPLLPGSLRPDRIYVAAPALSGAATDRDRVATLDLGVDLVRFHPVAAGARTALRAKWGLDAGRPVLLHVGHLRSGRNLGALGLLAGRYQVVVAASRHTGIESDRLHADLEACGIRVFRGYQPDIHELYQLADCYVFPTLSPGDAIAFPLSVLEALACDLPVASTRFGALPARFAGVPGVRFVEDPSELGAAVDLLLAERASTRRIAEAFSWDAVADRLLADLGS